MAGSTFSGPLNIKKSDGTKVVFVDADGNIDAPVTTTNLTTTGTTILGDTVADTTAINGATTITTTSASGLTVGRQGATAPVLKLNAATASVATGIEITGAAAASGVAVAAISSGTNENLTLDAKGSGTITIAGTSTGAVTITPATTISGAATHSSTTALVGVTTVTAAAGIVSTVAGATGAFMQTGDGNVAAVAAAAAIPLTNYYSKLDSNAGATTQTLAASTVVGLLKKIHLIVDGGDDVVTVTSLSGGTTITFADAGDYAILMWTGTVWMPIELGNSVDGVTAPVLA